MIFDSNRMKLLRERYAEQPDHLVPEIVLLDRSEKLHRERDYLEQLASSVSEAQQKRWLSRLLSVDQAQHLGAWFEMMLLGWLRQIGPTDVEPEIEGHRPDFSVQVAGGRIVVEAKALLTDQVERERRQQVDAIRWSLGQIQLPFIVAISRLTIAGPVDINDLQSQVATWLTEAPHTPFEYRDEHGTTLKLSTFGRSLSDHVKTVPTEIAWISPEPLKNPLREKASQHRRIRKRGHPYVIAVLLESPLLSAEEVAEAWLGRPTAVVNVAARKVVKEESDRSGLHFFGQEIRHRTVSGTLVFKATFVESIGRRELAAWYIQNPFANAPIAVDLFPVEASYAKTEETPDGFAMSWRRIAAA